MQAVLACATVAAAAMFGGCARVEYSGFLGDYDGLKKIGALKPDEEAVTPRVPWAKYRKVLILPVETHLTATSDYRVVTPAEVQAMRQWFQDRLTRTLGRQLTVTDSYGPDVLIVRAAVTRLKPSIRTANAASYFVPFAFLYTSSYAAARNTTVYQGEAGVEIELLDSQTRRRAYAMVGMRFGTILDVEQVTRWGVPMKQLDGWIELLATRLWTLRQGGA
jgi:hypothetical protein